MVEAMLRQVASRWRLAVVALMVLVPPLYVVALLMQYAVNAPFMDDWELVPQFEKLRNGTLTASDLWSQHNEHRLLFPRLIMIGMAPLTSWNTIAENYVSLGLAACSTVLLVIMLWQTAADRLGRRLTLVLIGLVVWMMMSPVQVENWLWGWQLQWFLSILGVVATVWSISNWPERWPSWIRLWAAGFAAIVATYSLANGMFVWLVGLAMLLVRREPWVRSVGWTVGAIATIGSYYIGYVSPAHHPSKTLFLEHPKEFVKYVFVYLGRPYGTDLRMTLVLGGVLVALFLAASAYLLLRHRDLAYDLVGWWGLAMYGAIGAVTTAIGRVGFGVVQGFASRYSTVSTLFVIATMVLVVQALKAYFADTDQQESPPTAIWFLVAPIAGFAMLEYIRSGLTPAGISTLLALFFVVLAALVILPSLAVGRRLRWLEPVSGYRIITGLFLAGAALLVLNNYVDGTKQFRERHKTFVAIAECVDEAQDRNDPCLTLAYPDADIVWPRVQYLRKIHWGGG